MNMDKLYELIINNEELQDIPLTYIVRIAIAVFEAINSGECMYKLEDI